MEEILEELVTTPGVQGTVIIDRDGLVISSAGQIEDPSGMGVEFAEVFKSLETSAKDRGTLNLVSLEASAGNVFLSNINDVTYLIVQTAENVNLGRIRYDIRQASGRLKEEL